MAFHSMLSKLKKVVFNSKKQKLKKFVTFDGDFVKEESAYERHNNKDQNSKKSAAFNGSLSKEETVYNCHQYQTSFNAMTSLQIDCEDLDEIEKKALGYTAINDGKAFRYTMFLSHENFSFDHVRRILSKGIVNGLQKRNSCKILVNTTAFRYRGSPVCILRIEGKSKLNILKCRSDLPTSLTPYLITLLSYEADADEIEDY